MGAIQPLNLQFLRIQLRHLSAAIHSIEETSEEQFDRHFAVNVKATYFLTKEALSRFNHGGRIVNAPPAGLALPIPRTSPTT